MARPQTVNQLPDPIKKELNKKLTESSFSGYVQLTEWLNSLGYPVSNHHCIAMLNAAACRLLQGAMLLVQQLILWILNFAVWRLPRSV